eukprot:IDg11861t1
MALSCYQAGRACPACARERTKLQSNSTTMKLFPPNGPPEDVAMDLLGQLWLTDRGHTQLLVIVDRFTKMVGVIPLKTVYRILGVKPHFTATYYPKATGQTELFNRTTLSSLRRFIADHTKDWDLYTDALTYTCNTQAQSSTRYAPMELPISRLPPHMAMENYSQPTKNFHLARDAWISKLGRH